MKYELFMPTKVLGEVDVIVKNAALLAQFGKRAMVVTGRFSAKKSGALADVEKALAIAGIDFCLFDQVENNPTLETVLAASEIARQEKVDFVIGIGGGSPLDAAKAVAVLATGEVSVEALFQNDFSCGLPIVAIPTTAGTGSEATCYSVLVRGDLETKVSFGNQWTFPKLALLDYRYTLGLSYENTVYTAVDTFTHVFEGYLSKRSTPLADIFAKEGLRLFGECLPALLAKELTPEVREKLMYASFLGGVTITLTGVTAVHALGYCYTYYKEIPHGQANAFLLPAYLDYIAPYQREKIDASLTLLGEEKLLTFLEKIQQLVGLPPKLTEAECQRFTKQALRQKRSLENTAGNVTAVEVYQMWQAGQFARQEEI